jgi:hypothetical protein
MQGQYDTIALLTLVVSTDGGEMGRIARAFPKHVSKDKP